MIQPLIKNEKRRQWFISEQTLLNLFPELHFKPQMVHFPVQGESLVTVQDLIQ